MSSRATTVGVDLALERQLLATLANGPAATVHDTRLPAQVFTSPAHQVLYQAILEVACGSDHVTDFLVRRHLQETGMLRAAGGAQSVVDTLAAERSYAPASAARVLRELHQGRQLFEGATRVAGAASEGRIAEARDALRRLLDATEASESSTDVADEATMRDLVIETLMRLNTPQPRSKVAVPILGEAVSHAAPGSLITIGGQTGAGKSSLALYIADAFSRAGITPGIISIEDPRETWGDRGTALLSGVSLMRIWRDGRGATPNELGAIERVVDVALNHRLRIAFMRRPEHLDVLTQMRRMRSQGCEVLFVDYLQEIKWSGQEGRKRHEMLADIARDMKSEARRLDIPLFLLSQLRRLDPKSRTKEPSVHDLKETGDLENMSEGVILLWREEDTEEAPTFGKVAKLKSSPKRPRFVIDRDEQSGRVKGIERRNSDARGSQAGRAGGLGKTIAQEFFDD